MREERLSEIVATLESGSRPKGGVQEGAEGVLSLGAEHLDREGGFDFSKVKRIPNDYFKQMKKGRIARDDILVVKDGATTGKTSFISATFPDEPAAVNEHVFIVRVDPLKAFPSYVFRYLQSPNGQLQVLSDFRGATVGGVSRGFVDRVKIPLPPLPEQRRIAAILDKADAIRRKRQQTLDLADQFLRSAFLDMFGDSVTNPKGWPVKKLGDLAESKLGKMLSKASLRGVNPVEYLGNSNVRWREFDLSDLATMDFTADELGKLNLQEGDLLVCEGGEIGRCAIWRNEKPGISFQKALHRVRCNRGELEPEYLQEVLMLMSESGGLTRSTSTATIAHLTGVRLKQLGIPVPPIALQMRFVGVYCVQRRLHAKLANAGNVIQDLRGSLTRRAFRGEITSD